MRISFVLFLLFAVSHCYAFNISGVVKDSQGALPFANVSVLNSTKGSICDTKGRFSFNLEKGSYSLICSYLGYENDTLEILLDSDKNLSFILEKTPVKLDELSISSNEEDPAFEIIRQVILFKDSFLLPQEYTCNAYVKSNIEDGFIKTSKQAINLTESYSELFHSKKGFQEVVLSTNDYTEKSNFQGVPQLSNVSSFYLSSFNPVNPDIYFSSHSDVIIDWQKDQISLPRLNENSFTSPIALNALKKYDFKYLESYYESENDEIAIIQYQAKKGKQQCFSGRLFINNTKHYLLKIEFEVPKSSLRYYKRFVVSYENQVIEKQLLPKLIQVQYSFKGPVYDKTGNSLIHYSNYFIPGKGLPFSKNLISIEKTDTIINLQEIRPVKLNDQELKLIDEKVLENEKLRSEAYQDSIDHVLRQASIQNLMGQGITWRNRNKKREIHLNPVTNSLQLLSFGGLRVQAGAYFKKEYKNDQAFKLSSSLSYGFNINDLKWTNRVDYTYHPKRFGRVYLSGGDNYDFLSLNQSFSSVFSGANFIDRQHLSIGHNYELVNGLYWETNFTYQQVTSAADLDAGDWRDNVFPDNSALDFAPYQQVNWNNDIIIRFGQKYRLKGNKKIIIGSKYPEIKLSHTISLPIQNINTSSFNYVQIQVQDDKKWKKLGTTRYSAQAGGFLNKTGIQINNLKFFRGGDDWLLSNTISTFQLINREGYQTSNDFIQAHLIHHFNGFISQKIPGLKIAKTHLFIGSNFLAVNEEIENHLETYFGLEKTVTLAKQNYRFSISFHHSPSNAFNMNNYVKVGIDWCNLLTNKWMN